MLPKGLQLFRNCHPRGQFLLRSLGFPVNPRSHGRSILQLLDTFFTSSLFYSYLYQGKMDSQLFLFLRVKPGSCIHVLEFSGSFYLAGFNLDGI